MILLFVVLMIVVTLIVVMMFTGWSDVGDCVGGGCSGVGGCDDVKWVMVLVVVVILVVVVYVTEMMLVVVLVFCVVGDCGGVSGCSLRGGLGGVFSCGGDYVVVLLVVVVWGN